MSTSFSKWTTYSQSNADYFLGQSVILKVNGVVAELGMNLEIGDVLTIEPINYYVILVDDRYLQNKSYIQYFDSSEGEDVKVEFVLDDNGIGTATMVKTSTVVNVTTELGEVTPPDDGGDGVDGGINIYSVDNDIMDSVGDVRYQANAGTTGEYTDYGTYINSLRKYPFVLPESYVSGEKNILLGNFNTGVIAPLVIDETVYLDLGTVIMVGTEQNLLDYSGVTVFLHLPLLEKVEIETGFIVDQTISIKYKVNLFTGDVMVLLTSTKFDGVFKTVTGNLGVDIPYTTGLQEGSIDGSIGGTVNNDERTPYLEIITTDKVLADGFYSVPVIDENVLTNQTGFIKIEDINLNSSTSKRNKDTIISLLEQGVIINA